MRQYVQIKTFNYFFLIHNILEYMCMVLQHYFLKCILGTDENIGDFISIPNRSIAEQKHGQSDDLESKFNY